MADEKRISYVLHTDQQLPQVEGDSETGYSYEVQQHQYKTARRRRLRKAIMMFILGIIFLHTLIHFVFYKDGKLVRKAIGNERFEEWNLDKFFEHHNHKFHHHRPHHHNGHDHPHHHGHDHPHHHGHDHPHHHGHGHNWKHNKPMHEYGGVINELSVADYQSYSPLLPLSFPNIDKSAISSLISGNMEVSNVDSLFTTSANAEVCVPTVPVDGLDTFTFNPKELPNIVQRVTGNIGSSVRVIRSTSPNAKLTARAFASSDSLAENVKLTKTENSEGNIAFELEGPKLLNKGECIFADIVLELPESIATIDTLSIFFPYGMLKIDSALAHKIKFDKFEVSTAAATLQLPPIYANKVVINNVLGHIGGRYYVTEALSLHTVNGDIDTSANVKEAEVSNIVIESVSGSVSLYVSGGFSGRFDARTIVGRDITIDDETGSGHLQFNRKSSRVKSGTFSPSRDITPAGSILRVATVRGSIGVVFE